MLNLWWDLLAAVSDFRVVRVVIHHPPSPAPGPKPDQNWIRIGMESIGIRSELDRNRIGAKSEPDRNQIGNGLEPDRAQRDTTKDPCCI